MAELDKAGLREEGNGWDDKYAMYLAQGIDHYCASHYIVDGILKNNIPDWDNNKDVQKIKRSTPDEFIKAMLSLTECAVQNKGAYIDNERAWLIKLTGKAAIKLGLDINVIAQAKSLKCLNGYNWEFIEHPFPLYFSSKEIALLQNDL